MYCTPTMQDAKKADDYIAAANRDVTLHYGFGDPGNFTGVTLQGGTSGSSVCLVDTGNDVGGSVFTVQTDVDFNADFGSTFLTSSKPLYEIYGLHQ